MAGAVQAKDWDKLVAEVKKEEKDEQPDGDAGVQKLFRQIYASARCLKPPTAWCTYGGQAVVS